MAMYVSCDLDELEELFYWCTQNNNSLVVDLAPDRTGRIRDYEANTVIALAKIIHIQKNKPLPRNGKFIATLQPAFASSVKKDAIDFSAKNAVDGNMESRWAAADTLAELVVDLNAAERFNKITIFEQCDQKNVDNFINYRYNRIQTYSIDILVANEWRTIYYSDEPMGDCKVIRFPNAYQAEKIRLNVLKASAPASINEFQVISTLN